MVPTGVVSNKLTNRDFFRASRARLFVGKYGTEDPGRVVQRETMGRLLIISSWEAAAMSNTIMGSFGLSGFRYTERGEDDFVTFDPQNLVLPDGVQLPTADEPQQRRRTTGSSGPRIRVHN